MASRFHDQASYIAAFVAVGVGFLIFDDNLRQVGIDLYWFRTNAFVLSLIFLGMLSLGTYISALAPLSVNLNYTRFPLTAWLERAANFFHTFGLLLPLLYGLVALFSMVASAVLRQLGAASDLAAVTLLSTFFGGIGGFAASRFITRVRRRNKLEEAYYEYDLRRNESHAPLAASVQPKPRAGAADKMYEFLQEYEYAVNYAKEYLYAIGYGIRSSSLRFVAELLHEKGVIDKKLRSELWQLSDTRNRFAHAEQKPTAAEMRSARRTLDALNAAIGPRFSELINRV